MIQGTRQPKIYNLCSLVQSLILAFFKRNIRSLIYINKIEGTRAQDIRHLYGSDLQVFCASPDTTSQKRAKLSSHDVSGPRKINITKLTGEQGI